MGIGIPPTVWAVGQWLCRKSWTCSHSSSAQPSQTCHPHILTVPWPVLSSTMSPAPALGHPRMLRVPPASPAIRAWSGSRSLAEGSDGSGRPETAAPRSDGASRAVRGINAHRRFIFLPVGTLSRHRAAPLRASPVTLQPRDTAPWGPSGSAHPREQIPTGDVRGHLLGQGSIWSQAQPWSGSSTWPGPPSHHPCIPPSLHPTIPPFHHPCSHPPTIPGSGPQHLFTCQIGAAQGRNRLSHGTRAAQLPL